MFQERPSSILHREIENPQSDSLPEELHAYAEDAQNMLNRYKEVFYAIAQDRSVSFKIGNAFFIDLETREITLDVKDFKLAKEKGLSESQIIWSVCHEISHLYDLKSAPKAMLANFEYLEKRSADLVQPALEAIREAHGSAPEYLTAEIPVFSRRTHTMTVLQHFLYTKLHLLTNAVDDMYVNEGIGLRSAPFAKTGSKAREVERLYRDFLFPTNPADIGSAPQEGEAMDIASLPRAYQLAYYLLRTRMVPDQPVLVSPEVQGVLDGYSYAASQQHGITRAAFADMLTRSGGKTAKNRNPGWRYERMREVLEPAFVELLFRDLADQKFPPPPDPEQQAQRDAKKDAAQKKKQEADAQEKKADKEMAEAADQEAQADDEGNAEKKKDARDKKQKAEAEKQDAQDKRDEAGKEIAENSSPWDEMGGNPEPIDLDVIRDFIKQQGEQTKKQQKKEREDKDKVRLTPEERDARAQAARDKEICDRHTINPDFAREYREYEKSIEPYKKDLAAVFEQFMKTLSERIQMVWVDGFRSGTFDVDSFISKYGAELAAEQYDMIPFDQLDTYQQREFERRLVLFPNQIRVRLVLDGSGSMTPERLAALKQLVVLFLEGLATFEAELNLRFRLAEPIVVDTEVRMFGSRGKSAVIKGFSHAKANPEQEMAERFQSFGAITNKYGSTCDAEPLWSISNDLDDERRAKLASGRAKEVVFVTTDGGSNMVSAQWQGKEKDEEFSSQKPGETNQQFESHFRKFMARHMKAAAQDSRNALHALKNTNVIARGLQIGTRPEKITDLQEREQRELDIATFNSIWGNDGAHIEQPGDLASAVNDMFADVINKTELQLSYVGDESAERVSFTPHPHQQ